MVTREEFWSIMGAYGSYIWPAQIVFYTVAIVLVGWLFLKPGRLPSLLTKLFLAVAFAWNSIMFYFTLAGGMAGDGHGNYFTGSLFMLVATLFLVELFRGKLHFSLPTVRWQKNVLLLLVGLVFCYPMLGFLSGHGFASLIVPGSHPCPTVALGLLLLILALPQVDKFISILLILLAIPFTPFLQIARYGVYEDIILLATGIYGLILFVRYWKPRVT